MGVESHVTIFDRGYESADNSDDLFRINIPFITCSKVVQEPVLDCIYKIEYDPFGLPTNMSRSEEYQLYYAYFMISDIKCMDEGKKRTVIKKEKLICNLFLDPAKRPQCIIAAQKSIQEEYESLCRKKDSNEFLDNNGKLKCRPGYHAVTVEKNEDGKIEKISIRRTEAAIKKYLYALFSSFSYKTSINALHMFRAYKARGEQEKQFEQMKDQMDFQTQDASSQDGRVRIKEPDEHLYCLSV